VKEDHDGWEVVVMVDDILEVGLGFAAFVGASVDGGVDVVDGIDEVAPSN
jgi:hypothetical protein